MRRPLFLTAIALCLTAPAPSGAIDTVKLHIEGLARAGIRARDILLEMNFPDPRNAPFNATIAGIDLGPQLGRFSDLRLNCPHPVIKQPAFSCADASISLRSERFGEQRLQANLRWNSETGSLDFSASGLRLSGGRIEVRGAWAAHGWTLAIDARALALAEIRRLLGKAASLPAAWTLDGVLTTLHAQLSGGESLQSLQIDVLLDGMNLANPDGTTATADFGSHLLATAHRSGKAWQFSADLQAAHGEVLSGRWYWNFTRQPMHSLASGQWLADGTVALQNTTVKLGDMLSASIEGKLTPEAPILMPVVKVSLADFDFAALPPQTRDGALAGTIVSQLQGSGHFSGSIEIENDLPAAADLRLREVTLEDRRAQLAMAGLNGRILWRSLARSKERRDESPGAGSGSQVSWKNGLLYGVGIGGAALQFNAASNDVKLAQPARIPILDGGLAIATLQLRHLGEAAVSIRFDATLEPISVPLLCKAFGWPEFAGTLSGRIPDLNLEAGVLTLGGALQATVFDGAASVRDLKLSDPFGARPRLQANVRFDRLDLAAVTGAFSFGKITGRISGFANDLELVGWEPVAFDASLYTTPGDTSRHRISQRAVQNISSIGGGTGAAAALQRGVLRFFNEFNYSKLGFSCTLANDVCLMRGVEPHSYGYYLVKGRGLPRIDVIGDAGRIDWPSLVASLKQLPASEASVGKPP